MLSPVEQRAARVFIKRVRRYVPAELVQASLFGSKARGHARPDSDVDILLVFEHLPWDREPQATMAEDLADDVARETGIPLTAWSVALVDLEYGNRTPMLVDALEDAIPLWCAVAPLPILRFTPEDAIRCVGALRQRLREGSREFHRHLARGRPAQAARRARDDVIRACTAVLLTRGITRPRRGETVEHYLRMARANRAGWPPGFEGVLLWAASSYGRDGRDEDRRVPAPPGGARALSRAIDHLRHEAAVRVRALGNGHPGNPYGRGGIPQGE